MKEPSQKVLAALTPEPEDYPGRQAVEALEPLLTPQRVARMRAVLASRSSHVAFAFESMVDPHNLSAVLRSMDAFSFQDVFLMRYSGKQRISRGVTRGAHHWLSLHESDSTQQTIQSLKSQGYRVLASHLSHPGCQPLTEVDFSAKTALLFGNEHAGVSAEGLALADGAFRIDMLGMVESFNLSVAAAISAFYARTQVEALMARHGPQSYLLSDERRRAIYAGWLMRSVARAPSVLKGLGLEPPPVE